MLKKSMRIVGVAIVAFALVQGTISSGNIFAQEDSTNTTDIDKERAVNPYVITTDVADNAATRKFIIKNQTAQAITVNYSTSVESAITSIEVPAYGSVPVTVSAGNKNSVTMYADSNDVYFTLSSYNGYYMPVNYYAGGSLVYSTTTLNTLENGAVWNANKTETFNGQRYVISGNNYKTAAFGATELRFDYAVQNREPYLSYVDYKDQDGMILNASKSISFNVTEQGGSFTPDPIYTASNGRTYKLMSGYDTIYQSYEEGSKTHTFRYQIQEDQASKPYLITIIYKDGNGNVLSTKSATANNGSTTTFETAEKISDGNGVEYTRASGEDAVINHSFSSSKHTYTVVYEVSKVENPYDITIQYMDLLSGKVLDTTTKNVGVNKTVSHSVPGSIEVSGTTYNISADQNRTISHSFGTAQRVYTVYFYEKDKEVTSYDVSVLYFDVTNNKVLHSETKTSEFGKELSMNAPETYASGSTNYVLLAGQNEATHSFYSTRRRYVYFYRDVNDTKNEETVVEQEPGGGQNVVNPDRETPIINVTDEGNVTIPEAGPEGENLVINEENEVVIENNDTPDGPGKEEKKEEVEIEENDTPEGDGKDSSVALMTAIGVGVGALLLGAIIFIVLKKKNEKEENEA